MSPNCKRPWRDHPRMAANLVILHRTPEMMHHVEVSDLGEEASHGFSVVLPVSDGPGPAHKNNFSPGGGQDTQRASSGPTSSLPSPRSRDYLRWHHFLLQSLEFLTAAKSTQEKSVLNASIFFVLFKKHLSEKHKVVNVVFISLPLMKECVSSVPQAWLEQFIMGLLAGWIVFSEVSSRKGWGKKNKIAHAWRNNSDFRDN